MVSKSLSYQRNRRFNLFGLGVNGQIGIRSACWYNELMRLLVLGILLGAGVFVSPAFSACQCLCAEFRTRGGMTPLCPAQLETQLKQTCTNWFYPVDDESCTKIKTELVSCTGWKPNRNPRMPSVFSTDGSYHTCR